MAETRPYYTVQMDASGCVYDIRVNDGPVIESVKGLPGAAEFPVNKWLRAGANELSFRLRPLPNENRLATDASCSTVLYVREDGAPQEKRREVARLEVPKAQPARREGVDSVFVQPFNATVPFPLWRWFSGEQVADNEQTRSAAIEEFKRFHALLAARDLKGILAAVHDRDREYAMANYVTLEEQVAQSREEFEELLDPENTLQPFRPERARLRVFGNGRLVRMDLLSNGQSPLYVLTGDGQAGYVPLVLMRSKAWLVER